MTLREFVTEHFGTASQFARAMGVSNPTVYSWLKNPGIMKKGSVNKLARITGIDECVIMKMK
jgi:DNA invertase Pin-like site-specific DNA recombinase